MTKRHLLAVWSIGIVLFAGVAIAGSIVDSVHNFSSLTGGNGGFQGTNDQVCIYCHTPHGGISRDSGGRSVPLWNKSLNEGYNFTMYTSSTFDGTTSAKPTGSTLLCLSCHDGISNLGTILNPNTTIPFIGYQTIGQANAVFPTFINIGTDLSNDHPVSFDYNSALVTADAHNGPTQLYDPGDSTGSNLRPLKLYNYRLECGTCHNPHDPAIGPFLRMSNVGSAMCMKCHNK